jgi:hypothetical protein
VGDEVSACREIQVTIPGDGPERETALAELAAELASLSATGFAEIWVDHGGFPALCALVNGEQGWLMWVRYDGDAGFSSRNPGYSGPSSIEIEYMLANGQVDRYPAAWAYSRALVFDALQSFARTRHVEGVSWFNDSGDGAASPDDVGRIEE